jgi:hypothetical protein
MADVNLLTIKEVGGGGPWRWFSGTLTLPRGTSRPLWSGWYHCRTAL